MFDPSKASKDKALKAIKKRALTDITNWAMKLIPDTVKNGLILDIKEVQCGDPQCAPIDTVFTLLWENGGKGMFAMPLTMEEVQQEDVEDSFPDEETLVKWMNGIAAPWPPLPELRFNVGDAVECRIGPHPVKGWAGGRVVKQFYREPDWPEQMMAPYQVQLKDGRLIYAPADSDQVIRGRETGPNDPPSPEYKYPGDDEEMEGK